MCCSVTLPLLALLSAGISAALLPRHVSSLIPILQSLEADDVVNVPSLIRSLGGCGTPICHTLLGDPPPIPTPIPELWVPLSHLLHPTSAAHGTVLAPDGSTVALAPLFAGIEVGLKRAMGRPGPTDSPIDGPYNDLDPLYAVTITEALGTSFLTAHVNGTAPLGPDGCWDDVDNPQNFTFMGPPSPIPDAVINGAMDGVLLGTRLAQDPIPLSILFQTYYGVDNEIARGSPHSSRRRQDFGSLVAMERLEEEVGGVLRVLRGLPHTRGLLEGLGEEEEADIAHRAAQEFMELYVGCPAIIPRCMWGARPYRGTPKALSPPLGSIYIHHTFVPSAPCRSFSTCARDMRSMQLFHQDTRGWDDIGYSFVVGSDGYLYQGRGWRWVGAHTRGHNTQGYGVGYVGNFSAILPDPDAISLVRDALIPCAVRAGWLHHNYTLHGHRQMGNTSCPGDALFQEIQSWHGFKMEVEQPPQTSEPPTLLKTYRWRTTAPVGDRDPARPRSRLQGWKRSYSHPESESVDNGVGKGSANMAAPKGGARRSLFQRAFSAPSKGAKEPRSPEGGKGTLQKYLRSMSKRKGHGENGAREEKGGHEGSTAPQSTPSAPSIPAPDVTVWDVSNFSLVDKQLVHVGRDEEIASRNRNRTGSSESSNVHPMGGRRDTDPEEQSARTAGKGTDSDGSTTSQFSNVKGLLWKRLRERKGRIVPKNESAAMAGTDGDRVPSCCGSHESLLPAPSAAELDLSGDNVIVRPVHGSVVGEKFCFQVITDGHSRSFGCSSLAERDRWIENLRRTVQPNKDNCERLELSLNLWVYEARDLPPRRRLRCHLHLDGTLFARTTAKVSGPDGELFWGELFQLAALPHCHALTLSLCRDDQGHPNQPVASVTVPLAELGAAPQPLERWYPLSSHGGNERAPALRVRGRYREVRVLPIVRYKELAEFITFHYRELCARLEPTIAVRHKEELAGALVRVLQSTGKAKEFLIDLGVAELDRFDERESLIFRENTLATKAIDEYMKLVGGKYLQDTLGEAVAHLCSSDLNCEVDPSKCGGSDLVDNQNNLRQVCEETLQRIATSCDSFPVELAEVFAAWQAECRLRGKAPIGQRLVSASLFLRFLCPAIMAPSLFGLVQEYPRENTARSLTLVAKVIQNMANFSTFGAKEPHMGFMNPFVQQHWGTMSTFLRRVGSSDGSDTVSSYDGYVDLALELATLHLLLCDIVSCLEQSTQEQLEPLPTILNAIRDGTPVPVCVQLSSSTERSTDSSNKYELPRELSKQLIKSQSMSSVRRERNRDQETDGETGPEPEPRSHRERRNVTRTQSVPAQSKAAKRVWKQNSIEHITEPMGDRARTSVKRDGTGRSKVSQQRKSMVPWQCYGNEQEQGELGPIRPMDKQHGRQIEALWKEVGEGQERLRVMEEKLGELQGEQRGMKEEQGQSRELLETLRLQMEEGSARMGNMAARLTAAEGTRKKDLERLKASEDRGRAMESRLAALEKQHRELQDAIARLLGRPSRTGRGAAAPRWDEGGDEGQATSV